MTPTTNPTERIREVMQNVITELVDHPSRLRVDIVLGEQTTVYEVHCDPQDRGKVIGKRGAMADSLRHLLTSLAARNRLRAILEIVD